MIKKILEEKIQKYLKECGEELLKNSACDSAQAILNNQIIQTKIELDRRGLK